MTLNNTKILIMYSGGLDSTLVAVLAAKYFKNLLLITYDYPRTTIGIRNCQKNISNFKKLFPQNTIEHRIINNVGIRREVLRGFCQDYFKYCKKGPPGIICLGCKIAMLVHSIQICLQENIFFLANGISGSQYLHPPNMPRVVNEFTKLLKSYQISYFNPVYEINSRAEEQLLLKRAGLSVGNNIGASNVTHQPRCFLGLYSKGLQGLYKINESKMVEYFKSKKIIIKRLLAPYQNKNRKSISTRIKSTYVRTNKKYIHSYEFSPRIDQIINYILTPIWFISKIGFYLGMKIKK